MWRELSEVTGGQGNGAPRVVRADPARRDALASILAAAFDHDPVSGWLFPDAPSREVVQRRFFEPFLDLVFETGEVHTTDTGDGVCLWLPVDPAEEEDADAAAPFDDRLRQALGEHADRFAVLSAGMDDVHPGHEKHDYLLFIGVAPERQGVGVGTRLLTDRLATLDATGTASYLEASCPRNQKLYERLGFRPIGRPIALPDGPQLVPMWRPAGAG
jgi:ribosomal protein S18 acetylase RimI-like enzyme